MRKFFPLIASGKDAPVILLSLNVLFVATGCFAFDIFVPGLPQMTTALKCLECDLQWLISAISIGSGVSMLLSGILSDIYGRRSVMLGSLYLLTASSLWCCVPMSLEWLIMGRFLQGIGSGAPFVLCFAIMADVSNREKRSVYFAYLSASLTVCLTLAPIIGGYCVGIWHWRAAFWCVFWLSALSAGLAFLFLPETHPERTPPSWKELTRSYLDMLRNTAFLVLGFTPGLVVGMSVAFFTLAAHIIIPVFHFTPTQYGWYQGSFMLIQTLGGLITGQLVPRIGLPAVTKLGVYGAGVGGVLFWLCVWSWPTSLMPFTIAMLIFSVALNIVWITFIDQGMQLYPHTFGAASALQGGLRALALALCVQGAGWVAQGHGFIGLAICIAAVSVVALILFQLIVLPYISTSSRPSSS